MEDYEHHIFISYRRTPTIGPWVKNHLVPRLEARLDDIATKPITVFFDDRMETGTRWPEDLSRSLKSSGILLAVWSTNYFRSPWCMAEWKSFLQREKQLNLGTVNHPRGLVFPIRYAGEDYPAEAMETQWRYDFSALNYPDDEFRNTKKYLKFDELIQKMSKDLVRFIGQLPPYKDDFPLVEIPTLAPPPVMIRPVL